MPDNWEYPWFAAWDLAFHCVAIAEFDVDFAKVKLPSKESRQQGDLILCERAIKENERKKRSISTKYEI
jgi:hypothetical protein